MLGAGRDLSDLTLLKKIAEGGMGEIFLAARAEPAGFSPPVVVKALREELASDSTFVDMLVDEANIAMRLKHPNIVEVLDFGVHGSDYFLAMEYVRGVSLQSLLQTLAQHRLTLDIPVALSIALDLCAALSFAHTRRDDQGKPLEIVHRDVTPGNVLLSSRGEVKLTDFGLARASGRVTHTMPGVLKGRFGYMAPELLRYEPLDARADLFSVGCVIYEMLAGQHPASGVSLVDAIGVFEKKSFPPPSSVNPHVPRQLDAIVARALEARPDDRWPNAADLGRALEGLVQAWAAHWPDVARGRERLVAALIHFFPHLAAPPIPPGELAELHREAQARAMTREAEIQRPAGAAAHEDWENDGATFISSAALVAPKPAPPEAHPLPNTMPSPAIVPDQAMPEMMIAPRLAGAVVASGVAMTPVGGNGTLSPSQYPELDLTALRILEDGPTGTGVTAPEVSAVEPMSMPAIPPPVLVPSLSVLAQMQAPVQPLVQGIVQPPAQTPVRWSATPAAGVQVQPAPAGPPALARSIPQHTSSSAVPTSPLRASPPVAPPLAAAAVPTPVRPQATPISPAPVAAAPAHVSPTPLPAAPPREAPKTEPSLPVFTDPEPATAAVVRDRFSALSRATLAPAEAASPAAAIDRMLDQALEGSGGGRAYLVLRMDGGALGARAARAARGEVATTQDRNVSRELAFAVMSERKPRLDPLGSRPAMCAPLIVRGAPAGVLYVDAQPDEAAFVEADLELIAAIASSAALVIDNERLASRASTPPAPASLSQGGGSGIRPLPTATPLPQDPATLFREVRQGLIPRALPRPAGWDIASRCRLARGPTGDFHDFVETPNGRAGILVADVSDRESPAGLFTAAARTAARASLAQATSPADAIGRLNALIGRDVTRGSSLTLSYAEIDPLSGDLAYVNAGHLPPMFFRASQGQLFSLAQTGGVVSGDPNATFDQRTVRCQPGDFLVMITDGVTSAAGASREPFGWDRLQRIAFEQRLAPAAQLAAVLESAIGSFVGMAEPSDDLTIVVARRV